MENYHYTGQSLVPSGVVFLGELYLVRFTVYYL